MSNPFPGMNPYLESHWRDVRASLLLYIRDELQERLPAELYAQVEEDVFIDSNEGTSRRRPDIANPEGFEGRRQTSVATKILCVAEATLVLAPEPEVQRHIEIRDVSTGNPIVTAFEVLSPMNKLGFEDRRHYREKRNAYIAGGANVVEIDLIRDGEYNMAAPLRSIPPSKRTAYGACVKRATKAGQFEYYPAPLRERLPVIPIPLRPGDADIPLDLQLLVNQCYDRGRYSRIDYRRAPEPPFAADDANWADAVLCAAGMRETPSGA